MTNKRPRKNRSPRAIPKPPPLPLVSSDRLVAALRRLGFTDGPYHGSSHNSMWRQRDDGGKDVAVVVLAKKEIPRGTLKAILELANVSPEEFRRALK